MLQPPMQAAAGKIMMKRSTQSSSGIHVAADRALRGEHQVHILDGGARGALAEIVEQSHKVHLRCT
ncbi:hypothetical protein ACVIKO_002562 [Rhizobium ruizarguesonis]